MFIKYLTQNCCFSNNVSTTVSLKNNHIQIHININIKFTQ